MTGKTRNLAALVLIAVAASVSACGSSTPAGSNGSSSAGNSGANATANTAGTTVSAKVAKQEKAERFAECVRAHGVPHFPGPDATGNFNFGVDVTAAVFTAAVKACKSLQPPGTLSAKRTSAQQSAALRFAQCVRANGVRDFPDPANGEPLINTYQIPSANRPGGMTILNAATHKCGSVLGAAATATGGQRG